MTYSKRLLRTNSLERGIPVKSDNLINIVRAVPRKGCEIYCKLVSFTNSKSHAGLRLVTKSVTLNDLGRRNDRRRVLSRRQPVVCLIMLISQQKHDI